LTRLLQESRLPDSYASFRVLVRLDREKTLGRKDMAFSPVNKTGPMNLPTSPSAPGPLDALQTAAPAFQRTASTPNPDSVPWTRAPSTESERWETESAADATSSKQQRPLVSHNMALQLFEHLRAGQWEEAEDMLLVAGHLPLLQGFLAHKKTPPPARPPSDTRYSPTVGS
jgi:hypothetical protein